MEIRIFSVACLLAVSTFAATSSNAFTIKSNKGTKLTATKIAKFNSPWAMTFISENQMLVTTKPGKMWLVTTSGKKVRVTGFPKPQTGGQGGLGDVVAHPDFKQNGLVYFSMVESANSGKTRGAVVFRGKLNRIGKPKLTAIKKIWTQLPKVPGKGHFSHKIAFGPKGSNHAGKLFITSGDRQAMTPAQDFSKSLGKIIRLNENGSVPKDNPYQDKGKLAKSFWSIGHRNMLGIAFDENGQLWSNEMGPAHGDELNLIRKGQNYGWPVVSEGNHYNGTKIPNHSEHPQFAKPIAFWVPSIAPSGLVIYNGKMFPDWKGDAFIGGLVSRALVHVKLKGKTAKEHQRFSWKKRIREVEQGPSGALWVLEDRKGGRLLKLTKQ